MYWNPDVRLCPKGFTLIEMLIVLAIVGVLVAIAIPSYETSFSKGRRADGRAFALDLAAREEEYFLRHHRYTSELEAETGLNNSPLSQAGFYRGSVSACAGGKLADCFQVSVSALNVQRSSDLACVTLTITNTGQRGSSDSAGNVSDKGARCW